MDIREVVGDTVKSLQVKTKNSNWWSKWIWWILGAFLGLILIIGLVLESLHKSQKAAKAMHQRDVLLEKEAQAKVDAVIAVSEKKKQVLITKADKYVEKANKKLEQNKVLQERAEKNQAIIDNLRDWDDVTKRIKYNSSD